MHTVPFDSFLQPIDGEAFLRNFIAGRKAGEGGYLTAVWTLNHSNTPGKSQQKEDHFQCATAPFTHPITSQPVVNYLLEIILKILPRIKIFLAEKKFT